MSEQGFVYTGQPTSYEQWRARNQPMRPRRYYVHDTGSGRTFRDPSRERGGDPDAGLIDVTGQPTE